MGLPSAVVHIVELVQILEYPLYQAFIFERIFYAPSLSKISSIIMQILEFIILEF